MPDIMDFYASVIIPEPNSGCWLCVSDNNQFGYARVKSDGLRVAAHRLSYTITKGPIPPKMEIDHLCQLTCCVNPDHLEAVTSAENKMRLRRVREAKPFCKNGHPRIPENLYSSPSVRMRTCRICSSISRKKYKAKLRNSI